MTTRSPFRHGAAALLGALAAVLAGCSKPAPATPGAGDRVAALPRIRFKTDWYPQAEHGGFYQALAKGFYRDEGIDVDIVPGGPGILVPQLMLTGDVDIAMGRSDDIIVDACQGLPFVIVGVYMERDPQAILVHEEDSVRTFADLNNRTIMAVPGVYWLDYLKHRYHIDFRLIPANFGMAQFMADPHFIQQCFVTNEPYYVRKYGGHPRTLLLSDSGYNPYRIIFTTKAFLSGHPEAVRRFLAASLHGWNDFMNGDPSPAKALISSLNPNMPGEFMDYSIKAMRDEHIISGRPELGERLGMMTRARMQEQIDVLAQLKIIPKPIPIEEIVRFDLLPRDLQPKER
jgi:NitT/TauT family transport system substrate-binding protein